jgi:hypothetical protein
LIFELDIFYLLAMAKGPLHRGMIRLGRRNGGDELVAGAEGVLPGETATARAAHAALRGERKGLRALWPLLGPAFIAAVAYVDPGSFATNISGGAQFGYLLLWVILCSNLMAMLIQSMSAKLGIATGKNLPEVCRDRFPKPVTIFLWLQAEVIAMATDLAEFIGAALALNLLFGIPLFPAGLLTGVGVFGILAGSSRLTSRAPRACCSPAASLGPRSCLTSSICTPRLLSGGWRERPTKRRRSSASSGST